MFGNADAETYPLQKKRHSFEFLREIAHLRARTNTFGAVLRIRNALSYAIHTFFQERNFLYVHTPIITGSDCEGAGEMFRVTTMDLAEIPRSNDTVDYSADFFGKRTGLTVSGQLEGELLATAMGNIYTFGPTFRAENSNTSRHLAEFWMVEPEMAFAELKDDMRLAEEFLKYIFSYCLERCGDDMRFFDTRIQPDTIKTLEGIINSSFEALTYTEAVDILKKSGEKFEYPVEWGCDLQSEHERFITEKREKACHHHRLSRGIKAFYMKLNDDGKTVRAMDVLVPRIGEIIGGSEREDRYDVIIERMKALNLNPEDYWWYLDIRRYGSVPHAGFGLGFERTVQFVTGMQNIRDVIPFPRTPKNAEF
jgi:asparaginyl-tRNA synthetase